MMPPAPRILTIDSGTSIIKFALFEAPDALRDGKPVDTSMSFTPSAGMPTGTRSGDLDPGLVSYRAPSSSTHPFQEP